LEVIFGHHSKVFLNFPSHFVEEKKLYNISKIQSGIFKNDWMVADIVKKLTYVLVEKWVSVDSIWLIK
jgi:hypothetical protein